MKKLFILLFCLGGSTAFGQELVVDPITSGAIVFSATTMNSQLNTTNNKLNLIQKGQLAVTGQLLIVNDLQNKIYKGLSEVASVINNISTVKEIAECGSDIVNDVGQAI